MTVRLVESSPDSLGGTSVFSGKRVLLRTSMEGSVAGVRLDESWTTDPRFRGSRQSGCSNG